MPPARVLIQFAHPAFERSKVNHSLLREASKVQGVTIHDLYEAYPDFEIDVEREKNLLLDHDVIILQHPFYWYSTPSIFKEWQDLVLEHGWAYGSGGTALHGKVALNALSAGGSEPSYGAEGMNRRDIRSFLAPIEQTFHLCGVQYLAPFVVFGTHSISSSEILTQAQGYGRLLTRLVQGNLPFEEAQGLRTLNSWASHSPG